MIPIEGLTPLGRKKLNELLADLDRELQLAGSLVSARGKLAQSERVASTLQSVALLQKKGRTDVFTISSAMVTDDIHAGRTPSRTINDIVHIAEQQTTEATAPATAPAPHSVTLTAGTAVDEAVMNEAMLDEAVAAS